MGDNVIIDETLLEAHEEGPQKDTIIDEEEFMPPESKLSDSDNEVDDDDFLYNMSAPERIVVGLNANPAIEFKAASIEEFGSDDGYCPSDEELLTNYYSGEENNYQFPVYDAEKEKYNPQLEVGMEFKNVEEFKQAVKNHGVVTRSNFKFRPNDDERAQAICKGKGCKFRIWASLNKVRGCVQIKSKNLEHIYTRDRTNRHCTARYIANGYLETFRVEPNWKTSLIKKAVNDVVKLNISDITAWRARRYAKILLEGSDEHQFRLLRSFAAENEIMRTNLGSTCIVAIHDGQFQGIYICLEACKRGVLSGCRQLIGLDGCFLKGTFGGQMLVAVALDANECIYPIAYAIVERENSTTWRWFVEHLGEDLKISNNNQ